MDGNYLQSLGFPADWEATIRILQQAEQTEIHPPRPYTYISAYSDPSGFSVGLMDTEDGFSNETFTVHGVGDHTVEVWQVMPGTAEVSLLGKDGETHARFLAFVDDPHMYPWYPLSSVGKPARYDNFQLGAVAVDVEVYDSVGEWEVHQGAHDDGIHPSPSFIASPWLFALYAGDASAQEASPISMFKAVVKEVHVVTNQLTGIKWYRAVADCGFDCVLALPIDQTPPPRPGSVVEGKVFLTGTTGFWNPDPIPGA